MLYILFVISLICKLSNNVLDMDWMQVFYPLILGAFGSAVKVAFKEQHVKGEAIKATHFIPVIALLLMAGLKLTGTFTASWWVIYSPFSFLYGLQAFALMVLGFITVSETHAKPD